MTNDPTPVTAQDVLRAHLQQYRAAAELQAAQAAQALERQDYSYSATCAHRALQFTRQAEAVDSLRVELLRLQDAQS